MRIITSHNNEILNIHDLQAIISREEILTEIKHRKTGNILSTMTVEELEKVLVSLGDEEYGVVALRNGKWFGTV